MILASKKWSSVIALLASLTSTIVLNPSASAWSEPSATVSVIGGTLGDQSRRVKIDKDGNVYTTGYFQGSVDFDPGPGVATLTASDRDVFISKLDSSGNFLWAKRLGDKGGNTGDVITFDSIGNIYIGGNFSGTVDFNLGEGAANLTSLKKQDAFILKLDPFGNYLWAKRFGGVNDSAGDDGVSGIAVDVYGNVFATGRFTGSVDFGSSTQTAIRTASGDDVYIVKLNSAGDFQWVNSYGGVGKDEGLSIALDSTGKVYTAGSFSLSVDFDPTSVNDTITAANGEDAFILKLSSSGIYEWAKTFGASTGGGYDAIRSIAVDLKENVYAAGTFNGVVDFGASEVQVQNFLGTNNNGYDIFVLKLNTSGGLVWAKSMGGAGQDEARDIALDGDENVYTTGEFNGSVDFDPDTVTFETLTATNSVSHAFVSKLDSSGDYKWARRIGGSLPALGRSVATDSNGNAYIVGNFRGEVDFDPGDREAFFSSASSNNYDVFILKLNSRGEVDFAEAASAYAKGVAATQAAAAKVAAEAAAAAAKVAAEVAAAKREAEKQSARADIAVAVKSAKDLTVDSFAKAEIPGVNSSNIEALKAELLALPLELRNDFNQVLKVARKFEVVGNIASDQVRNILPNTFVDVGLISQTSKNKVALVSAVKKLPATARDSYAEIKAAIEAETKRIQARQDRLASVIARNATRANK